MEKRLMRQQLLGVLFVLVTGTVLHFVYGWSGNHPVAGALSAVNESVWEHMKLVFVPLFFLTLGEVFFLGRQWPNFLVSRAVSTVVGTALVPVLYYTYTGIVGTHTLWADILVFILAVLTAFALEGLLLRRGRMEAGWSQAVGLLVLWALAFLFVLWTYRPPQLPLFQDPQTLTYGLSALR